jgi:hypothetical protein
MGQSLSVKLRRGDDRVVTCVKGKGPRSELNIFRSRPTSNDTRSTTPPQIHNAIKMILNSERYPKTEDEKMDGVQFESQQPVSHPKQPRRPDQVPTGNVIEEILNQNRDDVTSYTLSSTSVFQQASDEETFVGEAAYYFLNHNKVSTSQIESVNKH